MTGGPRLLADFGKETMMLLKCRDDSSSFSDVRWQKSWRSSRLLMVLLMGLVIGPTADAADDFNSDSFLAWIAQANQDDEETTMVEENESENEGEVKADDDDDEDVEEDVEERDEFDNEGDDEATGGIFGGRSTDLLPSVVSGRFNVPALAAASTATGEIGNGSVPKGFRVDSPRPIAPLPELANERSLIGQVADIDASWEWSVTHWAAANTFSNPRYFEDVMLERHGHQRWGYLQPAASAARFFTTIPLLPYKMAIRPACDCEYTLGYYRAGSPTPALYQRLPRDRKAILVESAAVAGTIIAFP